MQGPQGTLSNFNFLSPKLVRNRIVLPFVLANYKVQPPTATDEANRYEVTEVTSLNSLPDLQSPASVGRGENSIGSKTSVKSADSLTSLSPEKKNIDAVIDSVRKRLALKDERNRLELLKRTNNRKTSSPKKSNTFNDNNRKSESKGSYSLFELKTPLKSKEPVQKEGFFQLTSPQKPLSSSSGSRKRPHTHYKTVSQPNLNLMLSSLSSSKSPEEDPSSALTRSKRRGIKTVRFFLVPTDDENTWC